MERAQAQLEREWLDRLGTVAGRADELCRYAVLFGDPQLALTAVQRVLDVTAEEVQAGRRGPAAPRQPRGARLRARHRREPTSDAEDADEATDARADDDATRRRRK